MTGGFTKLDVARNFPGTVTKIHTGSRHIKVGDIIAVEWMNVRPDVGTDIQGKIVKLDSFERVGPMGQEFVAKVTLESGWYSMGMSAILTPEPGSAEDTDGNSILSFMPTVNEAHFENNWELSTSDDPGWHLFILGADSEERLLELEELTGQRFRRES